MVLKHFPRLVSDFQFTETDLNDQIKKILILFIVEPLETNKIEFFWKGKGTLPLTLVAPETILLKDIVGDNL